MNKIDKYKIVKVHWVDTMTSSKWNDVIEVKKWGQKEYHCFSIGFLLDKNKRNLVIANMIGDDNSASDYQKIPKGCIKGIQLLKDIKK